MTEHVKDPSVRMPAPAIGYSIVANLGGERQMTIQCFVGEDESDATVNARIDRIMRVVSRQKASFEIEAFSGELEQMRTGLARQREDVARLDAECARAHARFDAMIAETQDVSNKAFEKGYESHGKANKRGFYVPQGSTKNVMDRARAEVERLKKEMERVDQDHAANIGNINVNIARFEEEIAKKERQIKEKQALLEG